MRYKLHYVNQENVYLLFSIIYVLIKFRLSIINQVCILHIKGF